MAITSVKSGYNASLTITSGSSTYTGAELTDVSVSISQEPIDISDLGSTWRERDNGLLDWEITGRKNLATFTSGFLALTRLTDTVNVTVKQPASSSAAFSAVGIITRGVLNLPMGATTEEVTLVGNGTAPTIPA